VAVDRRDRRARILEHRAESPDQHDEKLRGVLPRLVHDPPQIDPGAKRSPRPGQHHRRRHVGQLAHRRGELGQQLKIQRVHRAVRQPQHDDLAMLLTLNGHQAQ
jgi:hypothetical protein